MNTTNKETNYEMVNHPDHYNAYSVEVIDMMEKIWGLKYVGIWCMLTAWKYRQRMGLKPGSSIEEDLQKEQWYLNKCEEMRKKAAEQTKQS